MNELLHRLPGDAKVLDLGCGNGSFDRSGLQATVFGVDLEQGTSPPKRFARADASNLPFPAGVFDAVVSNHSLEHVEDLDGCLQEIARVVKPNGLLYVAVPDSSTFCDRLYRWLADGGGHVNPFSSSPVLAKKIEKATGLPHRGTRTLCTSFSFLNRELRRTRAPRRLWLVGGGTQASLVLGTYFLRQIDRLFKTRLIVYGWAFFFGDARGEIGEEAWTNVCILCGAGQGSAWLLSEKRVYRRFVPCYRCAVCGTVNLFTKDEDFPHLNDTPPGKAAAG